MINRTSIIIIFALLPAVFFAQKKQLWAKSFINQKAPELNIGEWINEPSSTEDKFILVDFWATWCGPCLKAIPELNRYQEEFIDDLVVIGISEESIDKVKAFKRVSLDYASGIDINGKLNATFEIQGIPHVVLIDPKGIVRWEGFPFLQNHELTSKVIQDIIEKYK